MRNRLEDDLIGWLYDAAMAKLPWREVGAQITELLDGSTLNLFLTDPLAQDVELITTHGLSIEYLQLYAAEFAQHDLWTAAAYGNHVFNRAVIGSEIVPDAVLERSIIYNEFLRPGLDSFRFLGAMQRLPGGGFVVISTHRSSDAVDFDGEQRRRMTRLLPHLGRAIELQQRLDRAEGPDGSGAVVDRLSQGVIQLGPNGALLRTNPAADEILGANDGLARAAAGIRAASTREDHRLQQFINAAARVNAGGSAAPGGHLRISRPSGRQSYRCLVAPLGRDRLVVNPRHAAVVLFVSDPENLAPIDARLLQELYDLTPAEARIAAALAMGETLPKVAARLGISSNTARTLLARATSKTQTDSQLGLVRMILASLPGALRSR